MESCLRTYQYERRTEGRNRSTGGPPRLCHIARLHLRSHVQSSYAKAAQAELAQNWDVAYRLYIKSTEAYLHLRRITTDETARKRYQAGATKALDRAEKIKAVKKSVLSPIAVDAFSDGM